MPPVLPFLLPSLLPPSLPPLLPSLLPSLLLLFALGMVYFRNFVKPGGLKLAENSAKDVAEPAPKDAEYLESHMLPALNT